MPTLIVDQSNRRIGGRIARRVLIGRLPTNGVALSDSSVSRLHAWVALNGNGHYFVADTGSLTGTWVNGAAIARRRDLADGDVIRVGNTQITFLESDDLPPDVEPVDLTDRAPVEDVQEAGVLFDCPCGAPAWFKASAIGHTHQCRQCGRTVRIPDHSGVVAEEVAPPTPVSEPGVPPVAEQSADDALLLHEPDAFAPHPNFDEYGLADSGVHPAVPEETPVAEQPAPRSLDEHVTPEPAFDLAEHLVEPSAEGPAPAPPELPGDALLDLAGAELIPAEASTCSVCHSPIGATDPQTVCPSCGLTFHEECWRENQGCSAYGCPQVGVLAPPPSESSEAVDTLASPTEADLLLATAPADIEEDTGFPWEFLFLLAAVLGSLLGALSYGVPAVIGLIGTLLYIALMQESRRRRPVAWAAVGLCVLGIAAGVYVSHAYWKGWPPIGPWAKSPPAGHVIPGNQR